jgi:mono/diheme cytochrome c family protein
VLAGGLAAARAPADTWKPQIPRAWDEVALAEWATPLAGLGVRPTHLSADAYYALPVEELRTYPVYMPGLEPQGYWDRIQSIGPQPLIEPQTLETEADWIRAGERVFFDAVALRTFDPKVIAMARDRQALEARRAGPLPDGTISSLRWLPTKDGVALGFANCSACHLLYLPDGTRVPGASSFAMPNGFRNGLAGVIRSTEHVLPGEAPFVMGGSPFGAWLYQAYGAPWTKDPAGERLPAMTEAEFGDYVLANLRGGAVARWNGSILYPAKVPDLIGFKDRKYIDHTATHQHRGIGDLMRYAALVSFADSTDFGPHHIVARETTRFGRRLSDEALYALSLYIYSLRPPGNPNPVDERASAGEKIFLREGCVSCHTPPLYTNNKLTLAADFTPPAGRAASLDVLSISVGTDPGLALRTRKGTGYYKVPSLKGVWYRGHYLHDGAVGSLEEMFDPDRLSDGHKPGGWLPPGRQTQAIPGHQFGLRLDAAERAQLIAFLRTL